MFRTENENDAFWQKLTLPEEDRCRLHPTMAWTGSYRWFRSKNVIHWSVFAAPNRDTSGREKILTTQHRLEIHPAGCNRPCANRFHRHTQRVNFLI